MSRNPVIQKFFKVEIRNEAFGGIAPSTLDSAYDSLSQASPDVVRDWCRGNRKRLLKKLETLRQQLGGGTLLMELLPC